MTAKLKIIIPIETDADPSMMLDLAQAAGQSLVDELESYGESGSCDENEVSVEETEG